MNKLDERAWTLLYREFPEQYAWSQQYKVWTIRKTFDVFGRLVTVNLTKGERYY